MPGIKGEGAVAGGQRGVSVSGTVGDVAGDIVGGDKITILDVSPEGLTLLRQLLLEQSTPSNTISRSATAPFVGRREHFGSLIYYRKERDYIPFDEQATQILVLAQTQSLEKIRSQLPVEADRAQLTDFYKLCQQIGMLDDFGRFDGVFLENAPSPDRLSAPTLVQVAVTNACNFSCGHCFASAGNPYADEMTGAEICRLIDELAALGCLNLVFGGGEPLVRRDLPDLIAHANQCGVGVTISTNAVAASPQVIESLRPVRIDRFSVSMDAATEAEYDAIRGQAGAFSLAKAGIAKLKSLGAPVDLRCVAMKPYAGGIAHVLQLADELGADAVTLRNVLPAGRAQSRPELLLDTMEMNALWRGARECAAERRAELRISHETPPVKERKHIYAGFGCECGRTNCYVDPRGQLAPTGFLRDSMPAGSLRDQTLKQIWDNSPVFTGLRGSTGNVLCRHCSYFAGCRGGCRANALLLNRDIERPDANCAIAFEYELGQQAAENSASSGAPSTPAGP